MYELSANLVGHSSDVRCCCMTATVSASLLLNLNLVFVDNGRCVKFDVRVKFCQLRMDYDLDIYRIKLKIDNFSIFAD